MDSNIEKLSSCSCVVKVSFLNSEIDGSICGTILHPYHGLVLSHGSILTEHIATNNKLLSKVKDGKLIKSSDLPGAKFTLLLSNHRRATELTQDSKTQNSLVVESVSSSNSIQQKNLSPDFSTVKCHFIAAFRNNDFHNALNDLMPRNGWAFNETSSDNDQSKKEGVDESFATYNLLSYFLLFKFSHSDLSIPNSILTTDSKSMKRREKYYIGDTAEIIATPFAALCPSVFFNTYSRGVISNVSGKNNCWIVTDARCIPGSEGGPLYTKRKQAEPTSFLSGIVASSLCWKNNEWVGLSVACSIDSILESMVLHKDIITGKSYRDLLPLSKPMRTLIKDEDMIQAVTVLVQCGGTWGTGVVIDREQGIVLTCSHVIKDADSNTVTVTPSKSTSKYPVEVIYRQDPVTTPYDLALVKCPDATRHLPKNWSIQTTPSFVGEEVVVSGHAVFSTDCGLEPSVCQGVVSKIIKSRNMPVLIQTTCAVHAGVSGGPLLTLGGRLVGIVVCNTRDASNNTSFPHVNLCIPVATVWPVIENYLLTGDKQSLSQLQVQDLELKQLWALGTLTSQKSDAVHSRSKL